MPRRRASRRKSRRKTVFSILLLGLLLIIIGLAVYFASAYFKNSDKAADSKTQTQVVNPKKDPEEKKETTTTSSQAPAPSFDLAAIAAGDYSSAAGTWTNEAGDSLKLTATGLESATIQNATDFTLSPGQATGDTIYQASLTSADGTVVYNLLFVKGGTTIPAEFFAEGYSDTSDTSRDRLYVSADSIFGSDDFSKSVLYKSDND